MSEKISKPNKSPKRTPRNKVSKGLGATVATGLVIAGGYTHAIHTANTEKPIDREAAEKELTSGRRTLEGIISGRQGSGTPDITKHIPRTAIHKGNSISIQGLPTQETVQNAEVISRPNTEFLFVPGGISYKGHMQSMDQLSDTSQLKQSSRVEINWSKVDVHTTGVATESLPESSFDGLKVIEDQHGNKVITGVPNASAPNQDLVMLDLLSGAAEDGGIITVGVESDNPVTINLSEAREGYRVRHMPFADDQWRVEVEELTDAVAQLTDVLYERGIPVTGLIDVDRGERSTGVDTEGIPIVDRYMVIANPDGTPSNQAYQL